MTCRWPVDVAVPGGELWVFGYGSLMWRPGFAYREVYPARLFGYHRALCVWSNVHRGTPTCPGLVLGLDRGGCCVGRVYRVASRDKWCVLDYLSERELITPVYRPRWLKIHCLEGVLTALTFLVDRDHAQYVHEPPPVTAAGVVTRAAGASGPNAEYVMNTVRQLEQLGVHDAHLAQICDLIEGDW